MKRHITYVLAGLTLAGAAFAATPYEDVKFSEYGEVEESLTGVAGDAVSGKAIFSDKSRGNCVACHIVASNDTPFQGTVGPELTGVAGWRSEPELRGIVTDAKKTFPDSMMPSMYKTSGYIRPGDAFTGKAGTEPLPPLLSAQDVEDVVAYLLTLKE